MEVMATQHTPGPWRAHQTPGWGQDWCIHNDGDYVSRPLAKTIPHPDVYYRQVRRTIRGEEVVTFSKETPEGEARKAEMIELAKANARLIAAAPELLEALELLFERGEVHVALAGNPNACEALEAKCRAAIAKARGQ